MRIVYYTSGITGLGRLSFGIAIGNALARNGIQCDYTIVHTSPVGHLADDFNNIKIPLENEVELSEKYFHTSILYKTLKKLKPDVLLVNHQWFMIHNFIRELKCKKIYLSDIAVHEHFKVALPDGEMTFDNDHYDRVIAIEPFKSRIPMDMINPLIIKNRDEIYSREKSLRLLGLSGTKKIALYSFTAPPDAMDHVWEKYSYLEEDFEVMRLSIDKPIFPIVDYYNAFDLIVCGAGYNNVWSSVYFDKKTLYEPVIRKFHDESLRIETSKNFHFDRNGADQLVEIILSL